MIEGRTTIIDLRYVTVFCETWHNITQYLWFKRMGWKVAGIFPGNYTRWAGDQKEYRACTVHFYRLINNAERYSTMHPVAMGRLLLVSLTGVEITYF